MMPRILSLLLAAPCLLASKGTESGVEQCSSGRCPAKDQAMLQLHSEALLTSSAGGAARAEQRALLNSRWKPYDFGNTRRRCPRLFEHCAKKGGRCRFMPSVKHKPEVPPESVVPEPEWHAGSCVEFDFSCGDTHFCGATHGELNELAKSESVQNLFGAGSGSKKAKRECFMREGGYSEIPAWYKYADWTTLDKCIDGDMLREKYLCEKEQNYPELGVRSEFAVRMRRCAMKQGFANFTELGDNCADADTYAVMEKCKADVLASFAPPKAREGFKGDYVLFEENGDCCRSNAANVGTKKYTRRDRDCRLKCADFCDSVESCKFYSYANKWKTCQLCSWCKITSHGNAREYKSYKLQGPRNATTPSEPAAETTSKPETTPDADEETTTSKPETTPDADEEPTTSKPETTPDADEEPRPSDWSYVIGENNVNLCPLNSERIISEQECRLAADALGLIYKIKVEKEDLPKGCFSKKGRVRFNEHDEGGTDGDSSLVCVATSGL